MNALLSPGAALASAAAFGVADFTGAVASRKTALPSVTMGVEVAGLVALPFAIVFLPIQWDVESAALTFIGGAIGGFGLILFYRAMALNLIGVVTPITAVVAAALPTVVGLVSGEHLHPGQLGGIAVGLVAIALINGPSREAARGAMPALGLALIAGACFGTFFILFHAGSSAGAVAFVTGRLGAATTSIGFALASGVSLVPRRETRPLIALGGSVDGAGVVFYLFATFHGLLSLSALLASFYPAFTILCARLFTHERMSRVQAAGALLAGVAVALIAAT